MSYVHQTIMFFITDKCFYPIQYGVLKEIDGISSETILLLWSMKEKYNCDSKFKIYFDTLPEKFNTGNLTLPWHALYTYIDINFVQIP